MSVPRHRKDREPLNQMPPTSATMPPATGDIPDPVERLAGDSTHDEIARRAYKLSEERGGEPGRDWEDWFRAERELYQLAFMARREDFGNGRRYAAA